MTDNSLTDPMEIFLEKGDRFTQYIEGVGRRVEDISKSISYNFLMALYISFAFFVVLLTLSPVLINSENPSLRGVGAGMYNLVSFTRMCHQLPQRSLSFFGTHLPVDARSYAIYLSLVLGVLLTLITDRVPRILKSPWILIIAIVPILLDGVSQTILSLRESNNLLRFVTGFIFGFCYACFFASFLFRRHGDFKPCIVRKENFFVTFVATSVIIGLLLSSAGGLVGDAYMSRRDAVSLASAASNVSVVEVSVFYVSPHAVITIPYDPYLESYDDFVLLDVKNLEWDRLTVLADETNSSVMGLTGLWVVVFSDEVAMKEGKTVFTNLAGVYYYIDPVKSIILDVQRH